PIGTNEIFINKIIDELSSYSINNIILSGGHTLLNIDLYKNVISTIRIKIPKVNLFIYSNGIGFDNEFSKFCNDNNVTIIFIVFSDNTNDVFKITGSKELFVISNNSINIANKNGNQYKISIIANPKNFDYLDKIYNYYKKYKKSIILSEVQSKNSKKNISIYPINSNRIKSPTAEQFFNRKKISECLYQTITIYGDGAIHVCPAIDAEISSSNKDFSEVLGSELLGDYWKKTKDIVSVCKVCEYRYCCSDCNVLQLDNNKHKPRICMSR
ncbi:MAG: hypothetical protein PHV79_03960, partial [Clostridia bacterium]|nr:hypothetical protein [Clostridia bacterium]